MVAFAGYPLLLQERAVGVLALFSQKPLAPTTLKVLGAILDEIALGIDQARAGQERARLLDELKTPLTSLSCRRS